MSRQQIGACVCTFKRTEKSPREYGVAILESPGDYSVDVIIDRDGKPAPEIWDYHLWCNYGSFTFTFPKEELT